MSNFSTNQVNSLQEKGIPQWIQDLIECYPNDWWVQSHIQSVNFSEYQTLIKPHLELYENLLSNLDCQTRVFFEEKARQKFLSTNRNRGKQEFFNILNELFGYKFLKDQGYQNIQLVNASKQKSPDWSFKTNGTSSYCEVKTIGASDTVVDASQNNSRTDISSEEIIVLTYDEEKLNKFYEKIKDTIQSATEQIVAKAPEDLRTCVVYIILSVNSDMGYDLFNYKAELLEIIKGRQCKVVIQIGHFADKETILIGD